MCLTLLPVHPVLLAERSFLAYPHIVKKKISYAHYNFQVPH